MMGSISVAGKDEEMKSREGVSPFLATFPKFHSASRVSETSCRYILYPLCEFVKVIGEIDLILFFFYFGIQRYNGNNSSRFLF